MADCEPTKLGLKTGEVYTRRELVKALMVKSGNDVGRALARDVAGSQEAFADMMNRKSASLGMRNSNFKNPHGLTEPGQYSTARDMAIAARAAYRSPLLRSFPPPRPTPSAITTAAPASWKTPTRCSRPCPTAMA
jgi:serine-type D-Ala-D-Ala carboxypeptidase (penicillin-binding protein 5/6)